MSNSLDCQIDRTLDHNDIVPVLLGMWRMLEAFSARAEAAVSSGGALPSDSGGVGDREVVLAVLGILSLRRSLHQWLDQCESVPPRSLADSPLEKRAMGQDLLR
jgi:hypothetical protein